MIHAADRIKIPRGTTMRTLMKTALTAAVALVAGIAGTSTASADVIGGTATMQYVYQPTNSGECKAVVNLNADTVQAANAAQGEFDNYSSGFYCAFELDRATWDGYKWFYSPIGSWISSATVIPDGAPSHVTGWYADGSGARIRACFYMFDGKGWVGADHCTNGI